jgi:hypothetical protein
MITTSQNIKTIKWFKRFDYAPTNKSRGSKCIKEQAGYTHHMVQGICAKLPHREKETMNFSQPTIDLSKAHRKLDPLQDIQPEGKI